MTYAKGWLEDTPAMNLRKVLSVIFILLFLALLQWGNSLLIFFESSSPSESVGSYENGKLRYGKRLPSSGVNFRAYSKLGALLGRNSVNDKVREVILDSYNQLRTLAPQVTFVYGETGWPSGGKFDPHKTHQNGLSVDFFVPLRDTQGKSIVFPNHFWNIFGYGVEFDQEGRWGDYEIDFEAMAQHLKALQVTAEKHGLQIEIVIFDNLLQKKLFQSKSGGTLASQIQFSTKKPWVRHDEHYHINFK